MLFQRHVQAIGDEGDKDVSLDVLVGLVIDGTDGGEVVFQLFECLLDLGEADGNCSPGVCISLKNP